MIVHSEIRAGRWATRRRLGSPPVRGEVARLSSSAMADHGAAQTGEPGTAGGDGPAGSRAPSEPTATGGRRGLSPVHFVVLVVLVVAAGAFAVVAARHRSPSGLRQTGIPASVSTSLSDLMALSPVQPTAAPGFHLVDQTGHPVSLASLRGKAVVLEFMDPHCTDICPIVSKEFVDASRDLGATGSKVAFVAINVNRYHASTAAMAAFSRQHGLDAIPSWRFLTGPVPQLERAWHDYGITVEAPNPNADIIHTSVVYFIDPSGKERYLATPVVNHTAKGVAFLPAGQVSGWGKGIALVAKSLLA